MTTKARKEYVSEDFAKGLFSPYVMHPTIKKAASIYGIPDDTKKYFTADNWVFVGKEVARNDFIHVGFSVALQNTFKVEPFSPRYLLRGYFYSVFGMIYVYTPRICSKKDAIKAGTIVELDRSKKLLIHRAALHCTDSIRPIFLGPYDAAIFKTRLHKSQIC